MQPALYSLVQYVEDVERGETLNVGALMEINGAVLKQFVERAALNGRSDVVHRFEALIDQFVDEHGQVPEEEGTRSLLDALSKRRFPHFRITKPRQIMVDIDAPEDALRDICERLVKDAEAVAAHISGWY
jgi:hypothetical protein